MPIAFSDGSPKPTQHPSQVQLGLKRWSFPAFRPALFACVLGWFMLNCNQANKKSSQHEAELQAQYDYQTALQNYKIGINYLNRQESHKAIEHLELATESEPSNFRYHHGLGMAYSLNGQLDKAILHLKEAIQINHKSSESYNLLGSIYIEQERYPEAAAVLKKAIKDPSYAQPQFPYFNLGISLRKQLRLEEAAAAFKRVLQLDPKFYRAYIALGDIHKDSQDYKGSLFYYQKAEEGFPNNPNLLFQIGKNLFLLKRYREAKSYLTQVSILFPPPAIDNPTQEMLRFIETRLRSGHY